MLLPADACAAACLFSTAALSLAVRLLQAGNAELAAAMAALVSVPLQLDTLATTPPVLGSLT